MHITMFRRISCLHSTAILTIALTSFSSAASAENISIEPPVTTELIASNNFNLADISNTQLNHDTEELAPHFGPTEPSLPTSDEAASPIVVDGEKEKKVAVERPKKVKELAPDLAEWDRRLIAMGKTPPQRGWSKTLARMEIAYHVIHTIETLQTLECMNRPTCHETNPMLGRRPSKKTILLFSAGTALGVSLIGRAAAKTDRSIAKVWLGVQTSMSGLWVTLNYNQLK